MFLMVPADHVAVLAPHLVNYGFVRYLLRNDSEGDRGAARGVLGARRATRSRSKPGRVIMNTGSPTVVERLEQEGVEVIQVDFSESHRFAIAGLHCATLELVRDEPE